MLNRLLHLLLRRPALRERLAFGLIQQHYPSLQIRVPLSGGLIAPVVSEDAWLSFSEIFVQGEYDEVWRHLPLPDRWIDLGCHAGYFSLLCEQRRRSAGRTTAPEALLVDADARSEPAVDRMLSANRLGSGMKFLRRAIGAGEGSVSFTERPFMSSGVSDLDGAPGRVHAVPVIAAEEMLERFPPPYDLIKVDVEGSEYDFVERYEAVWSRARHLVVECHESAGIGRSWEEGAAWITRRTGFERLPLDPQTAGVARRAGLLLLRGPRQ